VTSQGAPNSITRNVSVYNVHCACGTHGGVVYNSDGHVEDVSFRNMTVVGTDAGAGIKVNLNVVFGLSKAKATLVCVLVSPKPQLITFVSLSTLSSVVNLFVFVVP
jgi:hypothetical protein